MTTLGKNVKITAPETARSQARDVFAAIGATLSTPTDRMDVFALDGDSRIGVAYVPDADALTAAQMRIAPWLELEVRDLAQARTKLEGLGLEKLDYSDKTHTYFVGPAGVVFRLAVLSA